MLSSNLLTWYDSHARILPWREEPTPYRVWISEIMLQQTRVETVIPYFEQFMKTLPDVQSLAEAPEPVVLKLWEGLGYYSRARNLQKAAQKIAADFGGHIPSEYDALLSLPGIGAYTAGAVASIAFGKRLPAIDGNVLRVMSRILGSQTNITSPTGKEEIRRALEKLQPHDRPGDFNQALMELGAVVCLPGKALKCADCPVRPHCMGFSFDIAHALPVKPSKKERRIEEKTVLLIRCQGRYALRRRPKSGLLSGLWEFPLLESHWEAEACAEECRRLGLEVQTLTALPPAKHIFSHIEWHMRGYFILAENTDCTENWVWATPEEIHAHYSIPSAFKKYRQLLEEDIL